jgi:hypothetical protein
MMYVITNQNVDGFLRSSCVTDERFLPGEKVLSAKFALVRLDL